MNAIKQIIAITLLSSITLVNAGQLIQTDPDVSKTVKVGDSITLKLPLTDFAKAEKTNLTFQWYVYDQNIMDFVEIDSATNHAYAIASVAPADASYYAEVVSDGVTTEVSSYIGLTVKQDETLIVQQYWPDGNLPILTMLGDPTVMKVSLTDYAKEQRENGNLSIQWYKVDPFGNKTAVAGATKAKYEIASTQLSDGSAYTCVVSDGVTTEEMAELVDLEIEIVD